MEMIEKEQAQAAGAAPEAETQGSKKELTREEFLGAVECLLYVSGEPIGFAELVRVFDMPLERIRELLSEEERRMRETGRGILLFLTDSTVQLVTNPRYNDCVVSLLSPPEERTMSESMLETLSIIAYRQPVTRADIEAVRGVRCEYLVTQLLKQGLIRELGRKDCIGRPMLFGTTDAFLRKFGLHSLEELPPMPETEEDGEGPVIGVV